MFAFRNWTRQIVARTEFLKSLSPVEIVIKLSTKQLGIVPELAKSGGTYVILPTVTRATIMKLIPQVKISFDFYVIISKAQRGENNMKSTLECCLEEPWV